MQYRDIIILIVLSTTLVVRLVRGLTCRSSKWELALALTRSAVGVAFCCVLMFDLSAGLFENRLIESATTSAATSVAAYGIIHLLIFSSDGRPDESELGKALPVRHLIPVAVIMSTIFGLAAGVIRYVTSYAG